MFRKNIRICYSNLADSASLSMTNANTSFPIGSSKKDAKGILTKSTTNTTTISGSISIVAGTTYLVCLGFTNITSGTVSLGSDTYNLSVPALLDNAESDTYKYSKGQARYAVCYITATTTGTVSISINVATSDNVLEFSRIIVGPVWFPKFNLSTGFNLEILDSATSIRSKAGNLSYTPGTISKAVSLNLDYLTTDEISSFIDIQYNNTAIFVSLFPEDTDKEHEYHLYGKIVDAVAVTNTIFTQFSSSIRIEEI